MKILFFITFLIENISVDKCSKNLNGFFCFKGFTVCQNGQFRRHIAKVRNVHFLRMDISITVRPNWMILFLPVQKGP